VRTQSKAESQQVKQMVGMLSRRQFSLGAAAAASLPWHALPQEQAQQWEQAVRSILGEAKPTEAKLAFDMPEIAENGNTVPFSVRVDSPMTEKDYVKTIHIISTGNPQPGVASFHFTPQSGKAMVSSRMRLGRTQDVIAIAELSDNKFLMSKRAVKVTIGGCGG
jgi:sulfur-oxidizing protein SoxY